MLAATRLKYVVESEWGSRRYLDVTLLERWPHRRANLWGCRKVRRILTVPWDILLDRYSTSDRSLKVVARLCWRVRCQRCDG